LVYVSKNVIYIQQFFKYKFIFFVLSIEVILKKASTTRKLLMSNILGSLN